jgi:multidrug transporter EmrE-like cation transporter
MKIWILAITSVAMSVIAQFLLRAGVLASHAYVISGQRRSMGDILADMLNMRIVGGLSLYCLSAALWLGVLANWEVSRAYPVVGLGFVLTVLVGYLLGEHVSLFRVVGVLLIGSGVLLVGRS